MQQTIGERLQQARQRIGLSLDEVSDKLKELGARRVYAAISHGVLSDPAIERINASALEKLVITDTIPLPENKKSDKIEVLSMAALFAKIINALDSGKSLSNVHKNFANEQYKG